MSILYNIFHTKGLCLILIGGRTLTSFRFADVIDALTAEQELKTVFESLDKTYTPYKMEVSAKKSKLMSNRANDIQREVKVKGQKLRTITNSNTLKQLSVIMVQIEYSL